MSTYLERVLKGKVYLYCTCPDLTEMTHAGTQTKTIYVAAGMAPFMQDDALYICPECGTSASITVVRQGAVPDGSVGP